MAASALLRQSAYRFRNDDGDEAGATWALALNTSPVGLIDPGTQFRCRYGIEEYGGKDSRNTVYSLITRVNGGAWELIGAAGSPLTLYDSLNITGTPATTQQITSGTYFPGELYEAGSTASTLELPLNEVMELEFCFELDAGKYGGVYGADDLIEFSVALDDLTLLDDYAFSPSFSVAALTQFSSLYLGGTKINEFYLGGALVPSIYYGSTQVYANGG